MPLIWKLKWKEMSKEQKKNILIYSFSGAALLFLMIFSGLKNNDREIENLNVDVIEEEGIFFTDGLEVIDLMTDSNKEYLVGERIKEINQKSLEAKVEGNPFVKDAQVYRNLKGDLEVKVTQSKPIARVFLGGTSDRYIDSQGRILPVNAKHTARVPLLETEFEFGWEANMKESSYGSKVFELLEFIEADDFWKAQIAHIVVKEDGDIELYPQVTKQKIEFGKPELFEEKFSKIMTFYKEILPQKGWNHYNRVSVKFKNQIICE